MPTLLAVDLGVRTGLAVFGDDGRLRSYCSRNFGNAVRLRRALPAIIEGVADISCLILEGGGHLAELWEREAARLGLAVRCVPAETWRARLLYQRDQRTGSQAKRAADQLARRVIEWSGAARPTSLRHDAAEAILIGLWAVLELGWLRRLPDALRP